MPYSSSLGLIHIAVPKTGSTSIINALHQLHDQHGGQLTLVRERVDEAFCQQYDLNRISEPLPGRAKHLSAQQLRHILGEAYAKGYSFSFVRNPWARAISRYRVSHGLHSSKRPTRTLRHWLTRTTNRTSFNDWLRQLERKAERQGGVRNQRDKLVDENGHIIVNYVGRLESLQSGFDDVCRQAGLNPVAVPHRNASHKGPPYSDYYDNWGRDLIAHLYQPDIELFGYRFGD